MEYRGLYISITSDCGDNEGGFFCQVYTSKFMDDEIGYFCIFPEELEENPDTEYWVKVNVDGQYRHYIEEGII